MTAETLNAILLFIGAVIAAVLFILDRQGRRLNESIPPDIMPLFMGLLALAETLAKATPTPVDDELIQQIRASLEVPAAPAIPADDSAQG